MVGTIEILAGNIKGLIGNAFGAKMELNGAELALTVTVASVTVTREAHRHGAFAGERDETEAMGNELVVKDGGVYFDFDEVNSDGGDLGDHDAAEGIGHGGIGIAKLKLSVVILQLSDFNLRESLVRYSLHFFLNGFEVFGSAMEGYCSTEGLESAFLKTHMGGVLVPCRVGFLLVIHCIPQRRRFLFLNKCTGLSS